MAVRPCLNQPPTEVGSQTAKARAFLHGPDITSAVIGFPACTAWKLYLNAAKVETPLGAHCRPSAASRHSPARIFDLGNVTSPALSGRVMARSFEQRSQAARMGFAVSLDPLGKVPGQRLLVGIAAVVNLE